MDDDPHASSHTCTHTHLTAFFETTQVSWYQKDKTNLDFTKARDSEQQWHQLDHMQVCTSLQTGNHTSTPPISEYKFCLLQQTTVSTAVIWNSSSTMNS